ncbi:MAG: c-type cytochrome [Vicinamibacterales bacterium]
MREVVTVLLTAVGVGLMGAHAAGQSTTPPPTVDASRTPQAQPMDSPTVKLLKGLTVPEFEAEMRFFAQALGVGCGYCHVRGSFSSDNNEHKVAALKMIEMTQTLNRSFFADHQPAANTSKLGKVTCYTCHRGDEHPAPPPGQD